MPAKGTLYDHLLIAGNKWELHRLTDRENRRLLKLLDETRPDIILRGFCDCTERKIYIRQEQGQADMQNTLLHEGLHALLWEIGCVHGLSHVRSDEKTISTLTSEILGYCKQTFIMPA